MYKIFIDNEQITAGFSLDCDLEPTACIDGFAIASKRFWPDLTNHAEFSHNTYYNNIVLLDIGKLYRFEYYENN